MRRKNLQLFLLATGLGLGAASAGLAADHDTALGSGGEVYMVRTGTYASLFPGKKDYPRDNAVLALDVQKPGAPLQRILVPGTGGTEIETTPSVVFEDDSQTVFLLWGSAINIHPILELAGFDGTQWSKAIDVVGNPFAFKTSPQFAITRDSYEAEGAGPDDPAVTRHRTILHLIWQEENAASQLQTFYTPLVINDGVYIGSNPVYNLDDNLPDRTAAAAGDVSSSLVRAPVVQSGRDDRTVVITHTSSVTGQLVTLEVDVLPEQLSHLADGARSHIIDLGARLFPQDLPTLAEKCRSHIIDLGNAFHPEVIQSIAEQVKAQILAGDPAGLLSLAEAARSHIIDLGAKLSRRGLRSVNGADATAKIVEIDDVSDLPASGQGNEGANFLQFRVISALPVPAGGSGTAVRVFVSQTGENLIVSWALPDRVVYRNSRDAGWSDLKELHFSDTLNLAKAYDILDQKVRGR
ncbi:MAG: hypothetical protein QOF89_2785 [Acidobacteriota bacterium]|jgi:hypothetical protein|nr:hypothetical protein [Acidobacteriota bacterium]